MVIRFDSEHNCFMFYFEHDGQNDIIQLAGSGYEVTAFSHCFYYGYEFSEDVDGSVRSAFIKYIKFTENLKENPNITHFIQKAIDDLSKKINLYDYDLVVMPESSSKVNQYMLRYIYRFAQPMLREMELVKSLSAKLKTKRELDENEKLLCKSIQQRNILIIDDIATSGSTLNEVLRSLRILNEENKISIFSLIGRKDLTIESME